MNLDPLFDCEKGEKVKKVTESATEASVKFIYSSYQVPKPRGVNNAGVGEKRHF